MANLSDYGENKLIDCLFRGIAYAPANLYLGLLTVAPTDSTPGTEVSGGGYARLAIACNTTNWSGTQGAGTTAASSGSSGTTSNNVRLTFADPTADWGSIVYAGLYDAPTGGNRVARMGFPAAVAINLNDLPLSFAPGELTFQIDN